jgi:hypothetical protein
VGGGVGVGSYRLPSRVPIHSSRSLDCSAKTTSNSTATDWNAAGTDPARRTYSTVTFSGRGVDVAVPVPVPGAGAAVPVPVVAAVDCPVPAGAVPVGVDGPGVSVERPGSAAQPARQTQRETKRSRPVRVISVGHHEPGSVLRSTHERARFDYHGRLTPHNAGSNWRRRVWRGPPTTRNARPPSASTVDSF